MLGVFLRFSLEKTKKASRNSVVPLGFSLVQILCTVSTRPLYWSYIVLVLRVQAFCTSSTEQLYYSCTTAIVSLLQICRT